MTAGMYGTSTCYPWLHKAGPCHPLEEYHSSEQYPSANTFWVQVHDQIHVWYWHRLYAQSWALSSMTRVSLKRAGGQQLVAADCCAQTSRLARLAHIVASWAEQMAPTGQYHRVDHLGCLACPSIVLLSRCSLLSLSSLTCRLQFNATASQCMTSCKLAMCIERYHQNCCKLSWGASKQKTSIPRWGYAQ